MAGTWRGGLQRLRPGTRLLGKTPPIIQPVMRKSFEISARSWTSFAAIHREINAV